jgi:hypothetical protein
VSPHIFRFLYLTAIAVAMVGWAWMLASAVMRALDN